MSSPRTDKFSRLFIFILCALLAGCAAKHPKTETTEPPVGPHQAPPTNTSGGMAAPVYGPQPETGPAYGPEEQAGPVQMQSPITGSEHPHVTLVLGGAGIASFATVGLLKKLQKEDIHVDAIVASGWPALFAVAYGYLKSVNDLEWFAMRLQPKDFYNSSFFEINRNYAPGERLSPLVKRTIPDGNLSDARLPIVLSPGNTPPGGNDVVDSGDWANALLKTMSMPGVFRPYPGHFDKTELASVRALNVDEAERRGAKNIIAIDMYGDYFHLLHSERSGSERAFRQSYLKDLRKDLQTEMERANVSAKVTLGKAPTDFSAKRLAILAGEREGAHLARLLRHRGTP